MSQFDFASLVTPERPIHAASMDRVDLANDSIEDLTHYFSSLRPFTPPNPVHQGSIHNRNTEQAFQDFLRQIGDKQFSVSSIDGQNWIQLPVQTPRESVMDELDETNTMHMTSVLRKRRIKMRKHKYKKLRKRTRALRKKLGK
ncbi:hypothetical protein BGZ54_003016 [Gamsiella multidivaricata]|nr:hypothetical protein BGZ54_003016 [Gamsiella multidivaricata]